MAVCFQPLHIQHGRWLAYVDESICNNTAGYHPTRRYYTTLDLSLTSSSCSGTIHRKKIWQCWNIQASSWERPENTDCFMILKLFFSSSLSAYAQTSHDCFPLFLHHGGGFLLFAGPCVRRTLLFRNVELLSWWRYRVLRDRAILHIPRKVPVPVHRHWPQPSGVVEGQWSSGSDVGNTGVWYHWSIAVSVTSTSSFPLEV